THPSSPRHRGGTAMEAEREAFLKAIAENRYDEAARRIYADWLEEHGYDDEALVQRRWTAEKQSAAEGWVDGLAEGGGMTREELIEAAESYLDDGEECYLYFDTPDRAYSDAEEFWEHIAIVTDRMIPEEHKHDVIFRCAC